MNDNGDKPVRPALKYYGGKWSMAPWVINHFPGHDTYCEPFGGAMSVLLQKDPAPVELVNDLNDRVVNFFQVLRDHPDDLVRAINLTPWSEVEYSQALVTSPEPLEDARGFFILCWASLRGGPNHSHFRVQKSNSRGRPCVKDLDGDHLMAVARRLKNVQILHRDGLDLVRAMVTEPSALVYCDPPYRLARRVKVARGHYGDQDWSDSLHIQLMDLVAESLAMVVISGRGDTYDDLVDLNGWMKVSADMRQNWGGTGQESLWLNPPLVRARKMGVQMKMVV